MSRPYARSVIVVLISVMALALPVSHAAGVDVPIDQPVALLEEMVPGSTHASEVLIDAISVSHGDSQSSCVAAAVEPEFALHAIGRLSVECDEIIDVLLLDVCIEMVTPNELVVQLGCEREAFISVQRAATHVSIPCLYPPIDSIGYRTRGAVVGYDHPGGTIVETAESMTTTANCPLY